jgi:hypothetical protein
MIALNSLFFYDKNSKRILDEKKSKKENIPLIEKINPFIFFL